MRRPPSPPAATNATRDRETCARVLCRGRKRGLITLWRGHIGADWHARQVQLLVYLTHFLRGGESTDTPEGVVVSPQVFTRTAEEKAAMSSVTQLGRSTATISVAQTAPIRIHHLTESLCSDEDALARRLPEAVTEALQLCARPITDAVLFDKALARDPALAAQLISIAGAGLFAPRATILGVRDAVLHLGLESIRDVLLLIVTNGMTPRAAGFETL